MRPGAHGGAGIVRVGVRIGGDDHQIGLCLRKGRLEVAIQRIGLKLGAFDRIGSVDEGDDLGLRVVVVAEGMGKAHIAQTGDESSDHLTAPEVMPRISWREKIT